MSNPNTPFMFSLPNVNMKRHRKQMLLRFGHPDQAIYTDAGIRQEVWSEDGLYINYEYVRPNRADLLISILQPAAVAKYAIVLGIVNRKRKKGGKH